MITRFFKKLTLATGILLIALLALASSPVGAEIPTIISTTFTSDYVVGTFDEELQSIIGNENGWVVEMTNPRVERSPYYDSRRSEWLLNVDSFTFRFTGPDADLLNDRVGQYLVEGWAGGSGMDLGLMSITEYYGTCSYYFYVGPDDYPNHIYFATMGYGSCQKDADGIPILDGIVLDPVSTCFFDFRPGYAGNLWGHTGSMSFLTPQEALVKLINALQDIIAGNPDKIEDVIEKAETALEELEKTPPDNQAAVGNIEGAVGELEAAVDDGLDPAVGEQLMDDFATIASSLAANVLNQLIDAGGDPSKIAEAEDAIEEGNKLRAEGKFKDAVNEYKNALSIAEGELN